MRKDLRKSLLFMLENLSQITGYEALRLMTHIVYLVSETQALTFNEVPTTPLSNLSSASGTSSTQGPVPLASRYSLKTLGPELPVHRSGSGSF